MRPPAHIDALAGARVLFSVPSARRTWVLARMFREADRANFWRKRYGLAHPIWGDGSLMTAALRRRPVGEPSLRSREYCNCLAFVLLALAGRGEAQPLAQDKHR